MRSIEYEIFRLLKELTERLNNIESTLGITYFTKSEFIDEGGDPEDAGKPIVLDETGHIDGSMVTAGAVDHGSLGGLGDNDHSQYLLVADIDDTPVNGIVNAPISSNWAYDHVDAADPHTGYRLESADHSHQSTGAQAGKLDHGLALDGLTDNDHTQYYNAVTSPIVASGQNLTFNWSASHHHSLQGLLDDDHSQYSLVNGTRAFTAGVEITGSADENQLTIKANATQSNTNPLILLEKSDGTDIMAIHSDDISNVFIGINAGRVNVPGVATSGQLNLFIGNEAGYKNASGERNVAIGNYSLHEAITTTNTVAIGHYSGYWNTANGNTFIGYFSANQNTGGEKNVALGSTSAYYNKTGTNNTCIGYASGYGVSNQSNGYNTLIGSEAGRGITTGNKNTTIGYRTGYAIATASNNILLGYQAGDNLTTGSNNIIIGYDIDASAVGVSNELNIGNLITGDTNLKTLILDGNTRIDGLVQFEGTTSSYPAIKRNTDFLETRLADDSSFCRLVTSGLITSGNHQITGQGASLLSLTIVPTGTTANINWDNGNAQAIDLEEATGDVTLTMTNPLIGASYILKVIQDSVTARDIVWPASVIWPGGNTPVISTTLDGIDIISLFWDGTYYFGNYTQDFS